MNKKLIGSGILFVLWIIYIVLLKMVDVAAIGPENTSVGFSTINGAVHNLLGFKNGFYTASKLFGYFALLCALLFSLYGVYMIVKKRHIMKVDHALLATYGLYFVLGLLYILFEFIIINYRPVIMPGEEHVEASFPSSHTMLAVTVMGSFFLLAQRYIRVKRTKQIVSLISAFVLAGTVITRFLSGVHWLTDIIGGIWISVVMLLAYDAALDVIDSKRKRRRRKKAAA